MYKSWSIFSTHRGETLLFPLRVAPLSPLTYASDLITAALCLINDTFVSLYRAARFASRMGPPSQSTLSGLTFPYVLPELTGTENPYIYSLFEQIAGFSPSKKFLTLWGKTGVLFLFSEALSMLIDYIYYRIYSGTKPSFFFFSEFVFCLSSFLYLFKSIWFRSFWEVLRFVLYLVFYCQSIMRPSSESQSLFSSWPEPFK